MKTSLYEIAIAYLSCGIEENDGLLDGVIGNDWKKLYLELKNFIILLNMELLVLQMVWF
ncbi:MAG: hypothetical protein F6K54_33530 [Okeania sp. SIO3B5]|uniref:hypothetical protein n=1 Tax=Okeania sp. SIO3B5 TaxID=2607811 RepID=UPI0013FE9543|nr:hypothetical protein [Okeania sp. SIO3B5]NEO57562.1 hypothetical protein [Okeania sp. SIO3B5]